MGRAYSFPECYRALNIFRNLFESDNNHHYGRKRKEDYFYLREGRVFKEDKLETLVFMWCWW